MKMRVSFLVLVAVIALCNTNASAKAVASAAEDEANSAGHGPAEQDPREDTALGTAVGKSNTHGGGHVLIKRQISSDPGRRRPVISKRFDKARKSESRKIKFEEFKERTVSNKTRSARKDKNESQREKVRYGRVPVNDWYMSRYRPKTIGFPPINPDMDYYPWGMHPNFLGNVGSEDHEPKVQPPGKVLKVEELVEVFHSSMKEGLESLFDTLLKELKHKLGQEDRPPGPKINARSSFIDTGDGPWESESTEDASDAVPPNNCSDDNPTTVSDSGNASSDMSKRSESSLEYLKETLPVIVRAAETILGDSGENTRSFGGGIMPDYGMFPWGWRDEAAETVPDDGIDNGKLMPWDFEDLA